ncbi:MAG: hypothetical protein IJ861_02120 [Clostridia bacterium]|nr:hypothetical protein [Clostridia bacterium]
MKKCLLITAAVLLTFLLSACSQSSSDESSENSENTMIVTADISSQSYEPVSEPPESSSEISLPQGIYESKKGYLKFINKHNTMTVTFPEEFYLTDDDYIPSDGIYLQNKDGTATLQLEVIENEGVSKDDLVAYLKETYANAEVYVNDARIIICKAITKDAKGNQVAAYLKAKITDSGYQEAVLYFHEEDKTRFEPIFNKITLS